MTMLKSDKSNRSCVLVARAAVASSESANSLEAQLSSLRAYAGQHDLVVVGEVNLSGISGHKLNEAADRLIQRKLDQHDFDLVLVTSVDRLIRSIRHGLRIVQTFTDAGIEVFDVGQGCSVKDTSQTFRHVLAALQVPESPPSLNDQS
jgi:DNA invertase Pin-like site-specific DNA recombinase